MELAFMEKTIPHRLGRSVLLYCVSTLKRSVMTRRLILNSTFASSAYTPGVFDTAKHFNVSTEAAILPLTLYVLGTSFSIHLAKSGLLTTNRLGLWAYRLSTTFGDLWPQICVPMHHTNLTLVHLGGRLLSKLRVVTGLSLLRRCLRRRLPCNWRGYKLGSVASNIESGC